MDKASWRNGRHGLGVVLWAVLINTLFCAEAEDIASEDLEMEGKSISIQLKSNDQGKFVKIIETQQQQTRGRIIFSADKAFEFRSILNEFVAEYERMPAPEETAESERIKTWVLRDFSHVESGSLESVRYADCHGDAYVVLWCGGWGEGEGQGRF